MPFGLCNAPATFKRTMDAVLAGLKWQTCLVYLDDVLVFSQSFQEHLQRLEALFQHLGRANLKLKPGKMLFCQEYGEVPGPSGV